MGVDCGWYVVYFPPPVVRLEPLLLARLHPMTTTVHVEKCRRLVIRVGTVHAAVFTDVDHYLPAKVEATFRQGDAGKVALENGSVSIVFIHNRC